MSPTTIMVPSVSTVPVMMLASGRDALGGLRSLLPRLHPAPGRLIPRGIPGAGLRPPAHRRPPSRCCGRGDPRHEHVPGRPARGGRHFWGSLRLNWLEPERINMAHQVSLMIFGAGHRRQLYAALAARDPRVRIAAVADPDEGRRTALAERHDVPPARRYSDWRHAIEQSRIADAAVIATLDRLHHEPALALAEQGYHLLLEKPMAVT